MKKIILLLLMVVPLVTMSQTTDTPTEIIFEKGNWAEVKAKSKATGKPIFVDCYTDWCGPCKMMANTVFKEAAVAEYFNQNFVNYKLDMEKGEGPELNKTYKISAFPTLLFLDCEGKVLHVMVGAMSGAEFVAKTKEGFSEKGLQKMQQRYDKGDRVPEFMIEYINVLKDARLNDKLKVVVPEFFATVDPAKLSEKSYWELFFKYVNNVDSPTFKYVFDHRDEFKKLYGESDVNKKLSWVWMSGANQYVTKVDDKASFDKKGFQNYVKRMKKAKVDRLDEIVLAAKISNANAMGSYKECVDLIDERVKNTEMKPIDIVTLHNWVSMIKGNSVDPATRAKMVEWLEGGLANLNNGGVEYAEPLVPRSSMETSMAAMIQNAYKDVFRKQIDEFSQKN